ncbi:MAG: single-stranded-DNA-specific exonuclease RecJ [Bacteroidetes bacterium GWF2_38_335]|nr:MAG: single-stranded-DNA-specific exonuclease RecJ [Bacteroidetes bacterium GWF2_38_335]OFY80803.1 MAG: single-stranded-DNA-specific exonuclease RecJ [Bacteroidetes bacterium RIFOXYA12_FULL_38_20]HBS86203.1 single-stranded-DNA-specific exonuclease RecJ [Bacteroidales bacterium]
MEKNWIIKELGDRQIIQDLKSSLNVEEIVAQLLIQRGITTFDEARAFFRPQLEDLHDPFLMKDMDKAVTRLEAAIKYNEKIMIYGDYDVDGTTAVALLYSFLLKRYSRLVYYIPDRYKEGYGVSFNGIDYASENEVTLIIALDCGIKAVEKVNYAREKKIDFIICDHHTPGEIIPSAAAVLNPKRKDCKYPYKELSGCGVGFKFMQAYCLKNEISLSEVFTYLDLVAVSIGSDIVPITGENRILAFHGLNKINNEPLTGIRAILDISGCSDLTLEINDVVFKIGPRINAAGRIESGRRAVELLITDDEVLAMEIAHEINNFNEERKELDHSITEEALKTIESSESLIQSKSTVLFNPEWHKGVIGIVASRLIEHYHRPTIILTESNGLLTGSARSVHDFDLYAAIDACSELLEGFGGHMYAAGLTLKKENFEAFRKKFEEVVSAKISADQLVPQIIADAEISLGNISRRLYRIINQFQPFGPENMRPVFISENVRDAGDTKAVGKNSEHLRLDVMENGPQSRIQGIAFNKGYELSKVKTGGNFKICYCIDENVFNNKVSLQIRVKDLKFN